MLNVITYTTEHGVEPYKNFFQKIKDPRAKVAVAKALYNMESGNPGDVKSVGDGVKEQRIHVGAGYRVYFYNDGQDIVILLCGGTKNGQSRDVENARTYLLDYKRQKRAKKKGVRDEIR